MGMTVAELFEHFTFYFDSIIYYDRTNNVEDMKYIYSDSDETYSSDVYLNFLHKFKEYSVIEWEYDFRENNISLTIENSYEEEDEE